MGRFIRTFVSLLGVVLGATASRLCDAATIVVDPDSGGDFTEIQPAIDATSAGDMVLVKPGEYVVTESITFLGKAITVRGENGPEETIVRMSETPAIFNRASVFVFESGEGAASRLEGCTLTGGSETQWGDYRWENGGGGVVCVNGSSPTLTNCTISGNSAGRGGGVYCHSSSPTLTNCTVSANSGPINHGGGAVYCDRASPTLTNCTISTNSDYGVHCQRASSPTLTNCIVSANLYGGVWCGDASSPTLTNCTVSANYGSGVECYDATSPTLTNCTISGNGFSGVSCRRDSSPILIRCTISGNTAKHGGGVYYTDDASPALIDCTISGNTAKHGGGVYYSGRFPPGLVGCTISGNTAEYGGGVYCRQFESLTLTNCTISGNTAQVLGGGIYCTPFSSLTMASCIVSDNVGESLVVDDNTTKVTYSCIEAAEIWPGTGNINDDPLFCGRWKTPEVVVNTQEELLLAVVGSGFYVELAPGSPCLGTGEGGTNMGAVNGVCETPRFRERLVLLAPGTYRLGDLEIPTGLLLEGVSPDETVIEGTVGLRTGARLSRVTVTRGRDGGIDIKRGQSPEIVDCVITANQNGGVICREDSSPTLVRCTISGNAIGSGLYCGANTTPTLTSCVVFGNRSRGSGGGLYCDRGSSPVLLNCTISGNVVDPGGAGAGLYCRSESTVTLTNSIVWDEFTDAITAEEGADLRVTHSCTSGVSSWPGEGNINDDPRFETEGLFDFNRLVFVEIDGVFQAFPDFVVDSPDYRLRPGSPAIDAGTATGAPGTDIDGYGRPCGAGVDMGAHEFGNCPSFRFLRGDCNADGEVEGQVADAAFLLNYNFSAGPRPPCFAACDTNGDGRIEGQVADALYLLNYNFLAGPLPPAPFPECGTGAAIDVALGCESPPVGCQR